GNSGRSPQPHLHFQLQATPYVGSKTLEYPLSYYINYKDTGEEFLSFKYPEEEDSISDIKINKILNKAFKLIPGMVFKVSSNDDQFTDSEWEVHTDAYNSTYITCANSDSYAYFVYDGTVLYFTTFEGDKNSLLYYFYLSAFKIFLGDYKSLNIQDSFPIHSVFNGTIKYIQDMIAPYYQFCKANYTSQLIEINKEDNTFTINTALDKKIAGKSAGKIDFQIFGDHISINKIVVNTETQSFDIQIERIINF
ncbi:MAG: hypothetical protein KAH72_03295, partial [Flavobacteriaceae bacterium]|nr:hypothetical protein [Flavobacteriaceae bacterium]